MHAYLCIYDICARMHLTPVHTSSLFGQGMMSDYSWTQSAKDVFLTVPCDAGTRGKDVSANLAPSTISLCIKVSLGECVTVNARARARVLHACTLYVCLTQSVGLSICIIYTHPAGKCDFQRGCSRLQNQA
jgi:hypothetical protein